MAKLILDNNEEVIHEGNFKDYQRTIKVAGERKSRGLIPRDYTKRPIGCYSSAARFEAVDMPLIPRSEWSERIRDMESQKSRLSDIRLTGNAGQIIISRDQDSVGFCWNHSVTSAVLLLRAVANLPYVDLSAFAIGCIIKDYQDEGGWGAEALDFVTERGIPTSEFWPQRSMSRSNDRPETWANAKLHRVVEGWVDLQAAQYDRALTFDQVATCLLCRIPVVADFSWWSHSVCGADIVDGSSQRKKTRAASGKLASLKVFEKIWGINNPVTAGFGVRIWNSWSDSWSDKGMGVLTGNQAIPDGSVAPRTTFASAA